MSPVAVGADGHEPSHSQSNAQPIAGAATRVEYSGTLFISMLGLSIAAGLLVPTLHDLISGRASSGGSVLRPTLGLIVMLVSALVSTWMWIRTSRIPQLDEYQQEDYELIIDESPFPRFGLRGLMTIMTLLAATMAAARVLNWEFANVGVGLIVVGVAVRSWFWSTRMTLRLLTLLSSMYLPFVAWIFSADVTMRILLEHLPIFPGWMPAVLIVANDDSAAGAVVAATWVTVELFVGIGLAKTRLWFFAVYCLVILGSTVVGTYGVQALARW